MAVYVRKRRGVASQYTLSARRHRQAPEHQRIYDTPHPLGVIVCTIPMLCIKKFGGFSRQGIVLQPVCFNIYGYSIFLYAFCFV